MPQMQQLAQLEADRSKQQQQQQQLQKGQELRSSGSTSCSKSCLLAVGKHVEGPGWPSWMDGFVAKPELWKFVAVATNHRMDGEQLACLCKALLQQQGQQEQQEQQQKQKLQEQQQKQKLLEKETPGAASRSAPPGPAGVCWGVACMQHRIVGSLGASTGC
jgi:hypothetical protein